MKDTFVLTLSPEPGTDTLWGEYWLIHTDGKITYDQLMRHTSKISTSMVDIDPNVTEAAEDQRIEQALLAIPGVVSVDTTGYPMVCLAT